MLLMMMVVVMLTMTMMMVVMQTMTMMMIILVLMLTMMMMVDVMVAMIMMMKVDVMVANPGHVPTRQSNERGISPTNQHGQVNNDIIIISHHISKFKITPAFGCKC